MRNMKDGNDYCVDNEDVICLIVLLYVMADQRRSGDLPPYRNLLVQS